MFQMKKDEMENLRCHFGTSKLGHGGRRYLPYAFTENGVAMLTVLKSKKAVQVNIEIMRAFVAMRRYALTYGELVRKIHQIEKKFDDQFRIVFKTLRELIDPIKKPGRNIGFK